MESLFSMAQEVFVTSIDPDSGAAAPNPEWKSTLGPAEEPFRNLGDAADEAGDLVAMASSGRMSLGQMFTLEGPQPRMVLLNFIPVHLGEKEKGLPVVITGEFVGEFPDSATSAQTESYRMVSLGRMTMGVLHDFNNLLAGILGHAELMDGALNRDLDREALQEHLRTIRMAAEDGAARIKNLQRYIRRENDSAFAPLDLPSLIQDCVVLTRPFWYNEPRSSGVAIAVHQDHEAVPAIMGLAPRLRDVLVNLMLNAVQAMPAGGLITLKTTRKQGKVQLRFSDTGVGMTAAVQDRIFEEQYTTKANGNGMGLSEVYGIMAHHNGGISVESTLGRGTDFTLTFPIRDDESEGATRDEHKTKAEPVSLRLLIVDDEVMVRSVLRRLLTLRGHEVVEAESGRKALEVLQDDRFDAIITDHGMPGMNGREFAEIVRQTDREIPILLLTGDTHHGSIDSTISAVLGKPFKIDVVESTLLDLVSQNQPR
ncbi:MAG: response regulator [Rhodothermales bacterium]|nr:response regulator [Rhodothermales bacterium]